MPAPAGQTHRSFWSRPPGWLLHGVALMAALGLLDACSAPGFYFLPFVGFSLLWILLGAIWLARLGAFAVMSRGSSQRWRQSWGNWTVGPLLAAIVVVMVSLRLPLWIRFECSRSALNRISQAALAAGPTPPGVDLRWTTPQRAGAFSVVVVRVTSAGEVDFRVPGTEFMRSFSGFAYLPSGTPDDPEGSVEPLGGSWYAWHTSW